MSTDNKEFNFSEIIPLKVKTTDTTYYSSKSDTAKREIAVVAALQLINTSLLSGKSGLFEVENLLPDITKAILGALEGNNK